MIKKDQKYENNDNKKNGEILTTQNNENNQKFCDNKHNDNHTN